MDHLIVSDDAAFDGMLDTALRAIEKQRRVVLSIHSYLLAPLVVSKSDLIVTLPRQLLEQSLIPLSIFETPLPLPQISLHAFWHDRTHEDPVNTWVRSHLFKRR